MSRQATVTDGVHAMRGMDWARSSGKGGELPRRGVSGAMKMPYLANLLAKRVMDWNFIDRCEE